MKQVIIGASASGIAGAKMIKKLKPDYDITVISIDSHVYSRCMLHKVLGKERSLKSINFISETFFEDNNIKWITNTKVYKIDTEKKEILLNCDGEASKIGYDNLLIATGATSFIPPINNFRQANNLFSLRNISDVEAIESRIKSGQRCVVVGSGLVGLDAVYALVERGVRCTVVEMADRILSLQLDEKAAGVYQRIFEKAGTKFILNKKAVDSVIDENGEITSIILDDNSVIESDFIIVAAGVRSNTEIIRDSGIAEDRGITVDDNMKTSAENVYAAGDVTGLSGIWPNAQKQGEVAGANMCGMKMKYTDKYAIKNTINFFNILSLSLGDTTIKNENSVVEIKEDEKTYKKAIINEGILTGIMIQGDISNTGIYQQLIKNRIDISGINKSVFELSFADFYGFNEKSGAFQYKVN